MQLQLSRQKREEIVNCLACYCEKVFGSKRRAAFYVVVGHYTVVLTAVGAIVFSNNSIIFRIAVICWGVVVFLHNVFDVTPCVTLLLYKIQEEYWPTLKSFLIFLNSITEDELTHIKEDMNVLEILRKV